MAKLRKLGRTSAHRDALLRNQVTSLVKNGRIETSLHKAKEAQKMADKMITLAKKGDDHSKRQVKSYIYGDDVVEKLFNDIAPNYEDRNGGYTRVLKLGPRRGDSTEMAILELV